MGSLFQIDETYEFSAPRFFDFLNKETREQIREAERWFEISLSYAPSPFMPKIRMERSVHIDGLCDFEDVEKTQKIDGNELISLGGFHKNHKEAPHASATEMVKKLQPDTIDTELPKDNQAIKKQRLVGGRSRKIDGNELISLSGFHKNHKEGAPHASAIEMVKKFQPNTIDIELPKHNQARKKQRLDGGRSRKIAVNELIPLGSEGFHEQHKEIAPYISTAEMVKKFQSKTREIELQQSSSFSQDGITSSVQRRPKPTLTRPKQLELQTAQRVRAVKIKSSAELEEEMLAKMPKFKARPLNKKILEPPSFPAPPKGVPRPPNIQEFHLKTMERANQRPDSAAVVSTNAPHLNQIKLTKLANPRPPVLETTQRARPTKIKSSEDLEVEELEKFPKFKAKPLNKKIFKSKGELGLLCQSKPQITTPLEFHFATNDRLGPPTSTVVDLFDKLSLHSQSSHHSKQHHPRITKPNPFHLHTEERGAVKENLFTVQILQKHFEEVKARIPKIPPKPQPKQSTKPELFHLESLIRHEEEVQKVKEEIKRIKREDTERNFKAQPIMKEDPIPLPDRERKPLTEVQEFVFHVDHRAVERSEFNKLIEVKEFVGKRIREEQEHAKMIEEEKEIKQMRRTMVPHARPLPKFNNPFHPQKSTKETTRPKSPKLLVKERGRKHALHMR